MHPTNFPESNRVFGPPPGVSEDQCGSLSVFVGHDASGAPVTIEAWKPDAADMERLQAGGRLWIIFNTHTLPPVALTTMRPVFEVDKT